VLPHDIDLSNRLQDAARVAATLAMRLNDIEEGRAA
jgi:hypothetical protein